MEIRDYLKEHTLLFDGAMGTYYARRANRSDSSCEIANLHDPQTVEEIHRRYIEAGARAVKTNTFAANRPRLGDQCEAVIRSGWELAARAAGNDAFVFADIGPVEEADESLLQEEYKYIASVFLQCGAKHFLFETNVSARGIYAAAEWIRQQEPDAFILVSFAVMPDGFTHEGLHIDGLLERAAATESVDAVGINCVCGARHMAMLTDRLKMPENKYFSVMPNAGYPTVRGMRVYYDGDPRYFADQLRVMRDQGAVILGGCCGTAPEHIAAAAEALRTECTPRIPLRGGNEKTERDAAPAQNDFWDALCDSGKKPFAVELDSPLDDDTARFLDGARALRDAGASIITIADCPIARARMDSSLMACKLRRELAVDALPHLTCRDRNLNATQALLLGLSAEGVRNVLLVTGDPIPTADRDEVKSVYNFNSRKLIRFVDSLNTSLLHNPFHIFAALNVNARNFRMQLDLAVEKEKNGAVGFLTQPVLTEQALENLALARSTLQGKLLGGIIPVVSQKNALFMNSEIAGIKVDEKIIAAYEGADRQRGEELAVEISAAVASAIAPYVDGFYLMTPFGRVSLIVRIMNEIRAAGLA